MLHSFAALDLHISLAAEPVFHIGSFAVTNSLILGIFGVVILLAIMFYVAGKVKRGKYNRFVGLVQWTFEGFLKSAEDIIGDKVLARKIFPIAMTIFFTVLITYWASILPGVGSLTWNGVPLFRGLPADLNFTFALAIITIVASQVYAIQRHGFFGNIGRYVKNPIKDPIGAFEGVLELIGEFSRLVALSLRLFGNAFAGEVLLLVIAVLTSYAASVVLPFFMVFELFIGFIQAYVFFVLTLIFTSLAVATHGNHDEHTSSLDHSSADTPKAAKQLE
ncbi:F0F1 ATP synthase subunit A [Candidatus Saccharibacteria bacterium]|nr:F0F1 ATP synthase subunit A [Candidatus Saccharibacteria bacterium]MBH1972799.1 F0F1 ATP synthase subunit A [Candidatus Saccharibacteria bacterium]MBH1991000.1 F0F1 ATP synthase subunit A [Candidatus Saccharibacteria bacterium]OGL23264.1 MAG: ATP synthase subunit A [Candidatus Saccharibacteria bacterium RIFCSPHIGHO2_01_FULL_46_30]